MKRILSLLVIASLLFTLLPSCRQTADPISSEPVSAQPAALALAETAFPYSGCTDPDSVERLHLEDGADQLTFYMENAYRLEDPWEDAAVIRTAGVSAFEIAAVRFAGEDAARRGEDCLRDYLRGREGDFTGYAPAQADMAANGLVFRNGVWLGLFICPAPEGAQAAFGAVLSGESLPELPTPAPTPEPATGMELLKNTMIDFFSEELAQLEGYSVSMYGDSEDFPQMIEEAYGVAADQVMDGFVIDGAGDTLFMLIVLRMIDWDSAGENMEALSDYKRSRMEDIFMEWDSEKDEFVLPRENLEGYQEAYARTQLGRVNSDNGAFLYFLSCQNKDDASDALKRAITRQSQEGSQPVEIADGIFFVDVSSTEAKGEPDPDHPGRVRYIQPNKENMDIYDTSAILAAWASGNPDGLSAYDRAVYDSARDVLESILRDGMNDFSKEAAIYEWVLQNLEYDSGHTDVMKETSRDSYTPYGGLVNHTAVCLGYATTFQLLMELAGVECITVVGAGVGSAEDHAWNQVRLNGEWYCVDATWDWPYLETGKMNGREWRYFNVTSDYMSRTGHQWDYDSIPEAAATDHGYQKVG